MTWIPVAAAIAILIIILIAASLRIANEYERGVVFRLGRLVGQRGPGLYLVVLVNGRILRIGADIDLAVLKRIAAALEDQA